MRLRLSLIFAAFLFAMFFAFGSVNFAQASAVDTLHVQKSSVYEHTLIPDHAFKPNASGVIEVVHNDGYSTYQNVPFTQTITDVHVLVNGTTVGVKYIVGYFLWVVPIYSPTFYTGDYYSPENGTVYGAVEA